jgi:hypothetical protein
MRPLLGLVGIILFSQVSGCASLSPSTRDVNDQVDAWLYQREYGKARTFLAQLQASPSHGKENVHAIYEKIQAHIAGHEQQVMAEADSAVAAQEWGTAFDLYRDALDRVPDSRRLQAGQQQLRQRHAEYLEKLELERLIARGEWTLKDLETNRVAEAEHSDNWFAQYWLDWKTARAQTLGLELALHGKRALERKDLTLAKRILPLALTLSNTVETRALNTQLQETLQEEELRILNERRRIPHAPPAPRLTRFEQPPKSEPLPKPEQPPKEERTQAQTPEQNGAKRLMDEFRRACQEKNLAEAQQLKSQLEQQGVNSQEFDTLRKQLAGDVAKHVKQLIDIGATHYSQQRYHEAKDVWTQAQALDPKNEQVTARLKRVTRVLDKLQTLRSKSPGTP